MTPHIPRYRDILMSCPPMGVKLSGHIGLRKGRTIGGIVDVSTGLTIPGTGKDVVTGEIPLFNNIITDLGMNKLAGDIMSGVTPHCHAGTGTATEAATDTALGTFLASTNTVQSSSSGAQGTAPYYAYYERTFRFGEGVAEGNVSEIGFSSQSGTGELFSRARVKDGGGSPTTISVGADEWLDVTYEFRLYPDHILSGGGADDGSGTVTYSGDDYSYVIRPSYVTNSTYWSAANTQANFRAISSAWAGFFGSASSLGAATAEPTSPSGSAASTEHSSVSVGSYSTDSFTRDIILTIGLDDGNASGGVGAIRFHTGMGTYQMSFSPVVPKTNTKVWSFEQTLTWARATIP